MNFKIATRKSKLAQVQTNMVIELLRKKYNINCEKLLIKTLGDKILNMSLDKIGGKGLFVKDIEKAMVAGEAEASVHSMKDVPCDMPEGFEIIAMPEREDPRDVFISLDGIHFKDLKNHAKIGTSSKRRAAELKLLRPDIEVVPIRGNVQTRISKIETENLDGIVLAAAGLKRIKLERYITDYFDVNQMIPAIGQGALGIEVLSSSENKSLFKALDCYETRICVEAERAFMRKLEGDCHSTIGAYAYLEEENINMIGIFEVEGKIIKKEIKGPKEDYKILGINLALNILKD